MLAFRSLDDVRKARLPPDLERVITEQMETLIAGYGDEYDPQNDGYIVLVNAGTTDDDFRRLTGTSVQDTIFESVERVENHPELLVAYWIASNSFCLSFLLDTSDSDGIDPIILARFLSELQESGKTA